MKTFSEFTNTSLLREILRNNTDKTVDYDSIQYNGNKLPNYDELKYLKWVSVISIIFVIFLFSLFMIRT